MDAKDSITGYCIQSSQPGAWVLRTDTSKMTEGLLVPHMLMSMMNIPRNKMTVVPRTGMKRATELKEIIPCMQGESKVARSVYKLHQFVYIIRISL